MYTAYHKRLLIQVLCSNYARGMSSLKTSSFIYDCDNCRLTMYIQQQQRRLSSLLDLRTFTIVISVKQATCLGHLKGNLRMCRIVNTNW